MTATEVDGWDGEWVAAPREPRPGPRTWLDRLEPLRGNPGVWARFGPFSFDGSRKQVDRIRAGRYGCGFDAQRLGENGADWIYVKFEGEP